MYLMNILLGQRMLEAKYTAEGCVVLVPRICAALVPGGVGAGTARSSSVADKGHVLLRAVLWAATGNGAELALGLKPPG